MIVPHNRLSQEAFRGLVEEYVTRDGTELTDADLKVEQVSRLLESGKLVITYDEETGTCNIIPTEST